MARISKKAASLLSMALQEVRPRQSLVSVSSRLKALSPDKNIGSVATCTFSNTTRVSPSMMGSWGLEQNYKMCMVFYRQRQRQEGFASKTFPRKQSSPFDSQNGKEEISSKKKKKRRRMFVPQNAAVKLTDKARLFFKKLLTNAPNKDVIGIMLNYTQSSTGQFRMVFSFNFVTEKDIDRDQDEAVSLEVLEDGSPKPYAEALEDGLPKLYVSHNAFIKVLGATVDVDTEKVEPILYNREGDLMDPNA